MGGFLPGSPAPSTSLAGAVALACILEASADKPGNITPAHDFVDTTYADMVRSGLAVAPIMARAAEQRVGALVRAAVHATAAVAPANTNLGIVLLFAPLARAHARRAAGQPLRDAVGRVLADLDVDDSRDAFAAIAAARPGGLGDAPEHDVHGPAQVDLRTAMGAAADRDAIAAEYAGDYPVVFEAALPALVAALSAGAATGEAIVSVYLGLLAARPDTLIARKAGPEAAARVSEAAGRALHGTLSRGELDAMLRADGNRLNPGATADLVAATLLAAALEGVGLP